MGVDERKGYDENFHLDPFLWLMLRDCDPAELAARSWVELHKKGEFRFSFLNRECRIDPQAETIVIARSAGFREASFMEALVALTYLVKAAPITPSGNLATEKDLKGGALFFQGPHALLKNPVLKRFQSQPVDMVKAGEALGGVAVDYGDAAVKLRPLPKIPVIYVLHRGDEEFDAKLVIIFDKTIQDHLALDVIWALINVTSMWLLKSAD